MAQPAPEIYHSEYNFIPYKDSMRSVRGLVRSNAPQDGNVLDLMCGTGFLLQCIKVDRPDLSLTGMDIDSAYLAHARAENFDIRFERGDVRTWFPSQLQDVVLCTGALHHVPYEQQEWVIQSMSRMVKPGGFCVLSDCYIDDFLTEAERRCAAAQLGNAYLEYALKKNAPHDVVSALIDILRDDVLGIEFKTSLEKRVPVLEKYFRAVETKKTWPASSHGFGDYHHILRGPRKG